MDDTRLQAALKRLIVLMYNPEREFADACWSCACAFLVDYGTLADAFDEYERALD